MARANFGGALQRWGFLLAAGAVGIALVALLFVWPFNNDSVLMVSFGWVAVFLLVAIAILLGASKAGIGSSWLDHVQVLSAFVTAAAIIVAAVVYFLERQDRTKLAAGLEISVIRPTTGDKPVSNVLLSIRVPVENKGNINVTIKCTGIDVLVPVPGEALRRSASTPEEMQLSQLGERIAYDNNTTRECVRRSEVRRNATPGSMRPIFMWADLILEPNEVDDQHFEIPVSCDYPFVRVLWKMRVKPEDNYGLETKAMVSLWAACRGEVGSTAAVTPSVQADAGTAVSGATTT